MRLVTVPPTSPRPKRRRSAVKFFTVGIMCIAAALACNYFRPLPRVTVSLRLPAAPPVSSANLPWPTQGHAALAAASYGALAAKDGDASMATASIAKVITALTVLEKKPLQRGETGPVLTMTQADVDFYAAETIRNGSAVPVYVGQQLTEYQLLQAMLVPSANNIANSLAVWAFGDLDSYTDYANNYVAQHGLTHTHIGSDASGYDPSTISTAEDLAQLGLIAVKNPVLLEIAGQRSIILPGIGTFYNYNSALGISGIDGLKTGNSEQNPGALLFSAAFGVAGSPLRLTGAVLGAQSLSEAISQAEMVVNGAKAGFESVTYLRTGQAVGKVETAWHSDVAITAKSDLRIVRWKESPIVVRKTLHSPNVGAVGDVGTISLRTGDVKATTAVAITQPIQAPSFWWRLTRH